ncbi:class I SAM-dependent methyltransferase [Ruegeria marina]|uniref:Methyltransferase domain-containing protein n=1 Tax=Ruegeria marina TaxID=639004 RepID=A0A1G6VJU9_9RHOB|nr:class I SAM-dependent methyltransferase [Ruegeria marina]SDD53784.1 Methyltransferase domain-containing protein [Ruegeria marina]
MKRPKSVQAREAEFWDTVVEESDLSPAESLVRMEDRYDPCVPWLGFMGLHRFFDDMIKFIDCSPGQRILDLGCGTGFLSIALALRGAQVNGIDISPKSIEICRRRAALAGVQDRIDFQVMDCENLDFPDGHFDAVVGSFVLHHLDLERVALSLSRVLRANGKVACIETMGLNPALMLARRTLPGRFGIEKASSEDEAPIDKAGLDRIRNHFSGEVTVTNPDVVFLRMGGYLSFLNNPPVRALLKAGDTTLRYLPFLHFFSYFGLVKMEKTG